ncbi:uncharacterized protein [Narcine bancroftii]|uniref:uncharacterized protein isoform X2 n=1 Tax=Narcine bancroftii TaxID=1343680 RepID=UPI003831B100
MHRGVVEMLGMTEGNTAFQNLARLKAACNPFMKCITPERLYFVKTDNTMGKSTELYTIEDDDLESQNQGCDSIIDESGIPKTSPVPKFANINEHFEEKVPQNPEDIQSSTVSNIDYKTRTNQWSSSLSNKETMLSIIFEESFSTMSENENVCQSRAALMTTKNIVENDSTPSTSLSFFSGKSAVAPKRRSRTHSQKSSNFVSSLLEKSIHKQKRRKRLPTEQLIRIQEWIIRQLNNIEEASRYELVIEEDK